MLTIIGTVLNALVGNSPPDKDTGEITRTFTAEILHKITSDSESKSEIVNLKFDESMLKDWQLAEGKMIQQPVKLWVMNGKAGLCLPEKKVAPIYYTKASIK